MKSTRRRRGKSQISETLQHKIHPRGHGACWSDSDEPQSKFVKFDAEKVEDFTKDGLKYFESVFSVRRSVVSLACAADGTRMFCSGTVVDHVDKTTWILTSASLVRKPNTLFEAYKPCDVKIEVTLHNEQVFEGSLAMCNLHYNIAIVTITFPGLLINLPAVELSDLPECYSLQPRPVVALGRDIHSKHFQMRCGELVRENSKLDCNELMVCTCDVSQICEISAKKCGGIEVGDIISELDGVTLYSVAQFTVMFLDKMEVASSTQNTVTLQALVRRPTDQTTFIAKLNVQDVASDECEKSFQNRWIRWKQLWFPEKL